MNKLLYLFNNVSDEAVASISMVEFYTENGCSSVPKKPL
jgi:hypothetical protein